MSDEQEFIVDKIHKAYRTLLSQDRHLFEADASERSLTHKLGEYLQAEFPEWNVDCEYNRDRHEVKSVYPWEEKAEEIVRKINDTPAGKQRDMLVNMFENGVTVFPDIIVHRRNTDDNLVVIEAKKSNFGGADQDEEKLYAYLYELEYRYAFKVTFPVGKKLKEFKEFADITDFVKPIGA